MLDLIIGNTYALPCGDTVKKLKLVEKYWNHAVFECRAGYKISYTYWELGQLRNKGNAKNRNEKEKRRKGSKAS